MKKIILVLSLMLLFSLSTAGAQRGPIWQDKDLNLTEQQQQKMEDLRFQHQKVMIQKNAALKEARLEMRNMMRKTEVDEKAVLGKQKQISALKAEIAEARLKHRLEMRKVLNKEQLEKVIKHERKRGKSGRFHGDRDRMQHKMRDRDCPGPGSSPAPDKGPR
ncbi:MAG: Spy/CpxP family protein refolding chaperone [Candidatus Zixiibacteriota bacterium]|nr:MAG: Spy/CpxP family protein refolding chaperone [candidate division Zixibacteria bacterium]